jgi:hypothetical protein
MSIIVTCYYLAHKKKVTNTYHKKKKSSPIYSFQDENQTNFFGLHTCERAINNKRLTIKFHFFFAVGYSYYIKKSSGSDQQ